MTHYAHSGTPGDRSDWQTLADHLAAVERLARERGAAFGLGEAVGLAGRLHDLGKYDPAFDRVLRGEAVRVYTPTLSPPSRGRGSKLVGSGSLGLGVTVIVNAYTFTEEGRRFG